MDNWTLLIIFSILKWFLKGNTMEISVWIPFIYNAYIWNDLEPWDWCCHWRRRSFSTFQTIFFYLKIFYWLWIIQMSTNTYINWILKLVELLVSWMGFQFFSLGLSFCPSSIHFQWNYCYCFCYCFLHFFLSLSLSISISISTSIYRSIYLFAVFYDLKVRFWIHFEQWFRFNDSVNNNVNNLAIRQCVRYNIYIISAWVWVNVFVCSCWFIR